MVGQLVDVPVQAFVVAMVAGDPHDVGEHVMVDVRGEEHVRVVTVPRKRAWNTRLSPLRFSISLRVACGERTKNSPLSTVAEKSGTSLPASTMQCFRSSMRTPSFLNHSRRRTPPSPGEGSDDARPQEAFDENRLTLPSKASNKPSCAAYKAPITLRRKPWTTSGPRQHARPCRAPSGNPCGMPSLAIRCPRERCQFGDLIRPFRPWFRCGSRSRM